RYKKNRCVNSGFDQYTNKFYLIMKITFLTNFLASGESLSTEVSSPAGTTFNLDSLIPALTNVVLIAFARLAERSLLNDALPISSAYPVMSAEADGLFLK